MAFTIGGQLITILFSFILTRVYTPNEFGLFGVLFSFTTLVICTIALNLHSAAPAAVSDEDGAALVLGSAGLVTLLSLVFTVMYLILIVTKTLGFGALPLWSGALVWGILFVTGQVSVLQYWCVRRQYFVQQGEGVVAMNGARAVVQVGLGLLGSSWGGLAIGEIAGRLAQLWRYAQVSAKELLVFRRAATWQTIVPAMMRYRHFATVLLPPMLLEAVWAALPVPLFNLLFGLSLTGQYFLMKRVLDLPVSFVSSTVSDAFYSKISELSRTDPSRIRPSLVSVFVGILTLATIGFSPLIVFGPSLFAFVFGEQWAQAGLMAAIMAPPMVMQIAVAPVARVFAITKRPALRYPFTWMQLIGGSAVFLATWHWHLPITTAVAGLSLANLLAYSVYIVTAYIAAGEVESPDATKLTTPDVSRAL